MAKIGRNHLCPCGSGKKYKRCCQAKDQEAEHRALALAAQSHTSHTLYCDDCYNKMTAASNAVLDLINAGKLDDAEQAAHDLLERFPDVHDGYARLGLIHELRGENQKAIQYYRKVIAFSREHVDLDEPIVPEHYQQLIDRLQPPAG
jgi:tetratricopeptide (TPR) repeat protein